jgi:hypothetical protein
VKVQHAVTFSVCLSTPVFLDGPPHLDGIPELRSISGANVFKFDFQVEEKVMDLVLLRLGLAVRLAAVPAAASLRTAATSPSRSAR